MRIVDFFIYFKKLKKKILFFILKFIINYRKKINKEIIIRLWEIKILKYNKQHWENKILKYNK
jgi:hypothetical protein